MIYSSSRIMASAGYHGCNRVFEMYAAQAKAHTPDGVGMQILPVDENNVSGVQLVWLETPRYRDLSSAL